MFSLLVICNIEVRYIYSLTYANFGAGKNRISGIVVITQLTKNSPTYVKELETIVVETHCSGPHVIRGIVVERTNFYQFCNLQL